MTAGLEVFSASGELTLSVTDRITKVLGQVYIQVGESGSVSNSEIKTETGWYSFFPDNEYESLAGLIVPVFNIKNGSISWSYTEAENADNKQQPGYLEYGVY